MKALIQIVMAGVVLLSATSTQAQFTRHVITRGYGDWGRCIGYLPQMTSEGRLNSRDATVVHTWTTTCHSAFSASGVGATIYLQKMVGGEWVNITSGISSYVPDLGPGTYRLVAFNEWASPVNFKVRHRQGLG